jgi:hypothetical protein
VAAALSCFCCCCCGGCCCLSCCNTCVRSASATAATSRSSHLHPQQQEDGEPRALLWAEVVQIMARGGCCPVEPDTTEVPAVFVIPSPCHAAQMPEQSGLTTTVPSSANLMVILLRNSPSHPDICSTHVQCLALDCHWSGELHPQPASYLFL